VEDFLPMAKQYFRTEMRQLKMRPQARVRARTKAKLEGRRTKHALRLMKGYRAYLESPECPDYTDDKEHSQRVNELFRSQFMPQFVGEKDENTFIQRDLPWLSAAARAMITDGENHRIKHYTEHGYLLSSLIPLHSIPFTLLFYLLFYVCKKQKSATVYLFYHLLLSFPTYWPSKL
jgi:hypothetical protein